MIAALSTDPRIAVPIVHRDQRREGAALATKEALRRGAAAGEGQHVLFLEDDVDIDPMASSRVATTEFPDGVGVISFCDMREVPEFSPVGLYRRSALGADGRGWWGNQALLIHHEIAAMCVAADWFAPEIEESPGVQAHRVAYGDDGLNCSDLRLALLVHRHGGARRDYAVHVPSLFRHVGGDSACFPGRGMGERETRNWIGDRRRFGIDATLAEQPR